MQHNRVLNAQIDQEKMTSRLNSIRQKAVTDVNENTSSRHTTWGQPHAAQSTIILEADPYKGLMGGKSRFPILDELLEEDDDQHNIEKFKKKIRELSRPNKLHGLGQNVKQRKKKKRNSKGMRSGTRDWAQDTGKGHNYKRGANFEWSSSQSNRNRSL